QVARQWEIESRALDPARAKRRRTVEGIVFPPRRIAGRAAPTQIHALSRDVLRIGDVGAQSGGGALFHEARTYHWEKLSIFHPVGKTPPQDPFRKESTHPSDETDGIAQRNKPQLLPCSGISQAPGSCRPSQPETQHQICEEMRSEERRVGKEWRS